MVPRAQCIVDGGVAIVYIYSANSQEYISLFMKDN